MSDLKVAIVGCGRMGRERARCVQSLGARLVSVFDVDRDRAGKLAEEYGAGSVAHFEDCFANRPDALFICVAPGLRGSAERTCVRLNVPFFVEKPIGVSLSQCENLLSELSESPVINAVGYMNRYRQSVSLVKSILSEVHVIGLSARWVCKRYNVPWWGDAGSSGGPHNEQATHLFDLSRFLLGDVAEVVGMFHGSSQASALLRFESGVLGNTFYSCDGAEKDIGLRLFTGRGALALSGWDFRLVENTVDGRLADNDGQDIFLDETRAFLDAVRFEDQQLVKCDFTDAAKTQAILDAVARSGQSCRPERAGMELGSVIYEV